MKSSATTPSDYLQSLPEDRRKCLKEVRRVIRANLPKGYRETMNWGMICYEVPLKTYPTTYNKKPLMYVALANQKNHMALYLCHVYSDAKLKAWFVKEAKKQVSRLDMGKSCVRFKTLADLPMKLVGQVVAKMPVKDFIANYERCRAR